MHFGFNAATWCQFLQLLPGQFVCHEPIEALQDGRTPYLAHSTSSSIPQTTMNGTGDRVPYAKHVGTKFEEDGSARPFPGNTIICHLPADSSLQEPLRALYAEFEASNLSSHHSLLPPSSWHMTVFEGICDQVRKPKYWPTELDPGAPLEECNDFFERRLRDFDLEFEPPIRMSPHHFKGLKGGISLKLRPVDDAEERKIRNLRERFSKTLSLHWPHQESYVFHISIAYLIRQLTEDHEAVLAAFLEQWLQKLPPVIELSFPEFCLFDDMFEYRPQFYIKPTGKQI